MNHLYAVEKFTEEEESILRRYVSNLDQPVFVLTNMPEAVKGALFARYSRSNKSLRRLLLDEFADDLREEEEGKEHKVETEGRASGLYDKVFVEYGDDSIAQLGGAHIACEQASNLLTKILERGRLMSYLEQSTRYLKYNEKINNQYRYYRPEEIMASALGNRYVKSMDEIFSTYGEVFQNVYKYLSRPDDDSATKRAKRAKALDAARGLLPVATLSNVGIYGSGQGYEALLMRMRASALPEARDCANMMLTELRKIIPSFLKRVDQKERGVAWSKYMESNRASMESLSSKIFNEIKPDLTEEVKLVDWEETGEEKIITSMLLPYTQLTESQVASIVAEMSADERKNVVRRYVGDRKNRRHKPGRALERTDYRFEITSDYGSFRDLQRHRLLSIEWQKLTPYLSYDIPEDVINSNMVGQYSKAMSISSSLYKKINEQFGEDMASYAVSLAYNIRYHMQFNAREAMHIIELRTQPQGHTNYRRICQEMKEQIKNKAKHAAIAEMMNFAVDGEAEEGRLEAERSNE